MGGRGARDPLDARRVRHERGADRRALLRTVDVAGRRGDRDERFQLALGAPRDRVGLALDPWVHARRDSRVRAMPELPEMEIAARRLAAALPGQTIESALAPGINALKTFDPPLHALEGRAFTGVGRRGKLLTLEVEGDLVVLVHLMSAGRIQLQPKRASLRDKTSRLLLRLPGRPRAAGPRVRDEAARVGQGPARGRARRRRVADRARARGVARPAAAARAARRAAAAAHPAARPAGHHRDRPDVGRRDPQRGEAVAVQARRRPRRRRRPMRSAPPRSPSSAA